MCFQSSIVIENKAVLFDIHLGLACSFKSCLEPPPPHSSWCSLMLSIAMGIWQLTHETSGESSSFVDIRELMESELPCTEKLLFTTFNCMRRSIQNYLSWWFLVTCTCKILISNTVLMYAQLKKDCHGNKMKYTLNFANEHCNNKIVTVGLLCVHQSIEALTFHQGHLPLSASNYIVLCQQGTEGCELRRQKGWQTKKRICQSL